MSDTVHCCHIPLKEKVSMKQDLGGLVLAEFALDA